jgi:hypothetical protein
MEDLFVNGTFSPEFLRSERAREETRAFLIQRFGLDGKHELNELHRQAGEAFLRLDPDGRQEIKRDWDVMLQARAVR